MVSSGSRHPAFIVDPPIEIDGRVAHSERRIGDPPRRIPQGIRVNEAPADMEQLMMADFFGAGADPPQTRVRPEPVEGPMTS